MSTNSPSHPRLRSLHQRLTVTLSGRAERVALLQLFAESSGEASGAVSAVVLNSADLRTATVGFTQRRAADRAQRQVSMAAGVTAAGEQHETASRELAVLSSRQKALLDGAIWIEETEATVRSGQEALQEAQALRDLRRQEQDAANHELARVLQQREALEEAISRADRHLDHTPEVGMDEGALRSELTAAGRAVEQAIRAHHDAEVCLADRQAMAPRGTPLAILASPVVETTSAPVERRDDPALTAVVDALVALRSVSAGFDEVDPTATALAEAWADLEADFAQLPVAGVAPSEKELLSARTRLAVAEAEFVEIEQAMRANTLTAPERAALDAAHVAVVEAEERLGRRWGATASRMRVAEVRAAERALLAHHGFAGYIDVVISGGRSGVVDPRHAGLNRERQSAAAALGALTEASAGSPERQHLESERQRLHAMVVELLGVDPLGRTQELLKAHRRVAPSLQTDLLEALAAAGIHPVGIDLESAASAYVESQGVVLDGEAETDGALHAAESSQSHSGSDDRDGVTYEVDLRSAEWEVDRLAEELQLARGSVAAVESELTQRASQDAARAEEVEALALMRRQLDADTGSLVLAQQAAEREMDRTTESFVSAEGNLEAATLVVRGAARKVRQLAEELPGGAGSSGDPIEDLTGLVGRLKHHASSLDPARSQAENDVAATSQRLAEARAAALLADTVADEGVGEDLIAGFETVLQTANPDLLVVLDEPFGDLDDAATGVLLHTLVQAAEDRQIVMLSEDPNILAWAIELPAPAGTAIPAAVLRRDLEHTAPPELPAAAVVPRVPVAAVVPAAAVVPRVPVAAVVPAAAVVPRVPVAAVVPAASQAPVAATAPVATNRRWAGQRSPLVQSD